MSDGREAVLARVRAALGPAAEIPEVPRAYRQAGALGAGGDSVTMDLFCARVAGLSGDCETSARRRAAGRADGRVRTARGPPHRGACAGPPWTVEGVELVRDDPPLSPRQLDELDGVLSGCALAIAETGTIVLDGVGASGRRALTLVPDYHLCVVRSDDIVPSVPDAVAALARVAAEGRPITFISGPSATVDIELSALRVSTVPHTRRVRRRVVKAAWVSEFVARWIARLTTHGRS